MARTRNAYIRPDGTSPARPCDRSSPCTTTKHRRGAPVSRGVPLVVVVVVSRGVLLRGVLLRGVLLRGVLLLPRLLTMPTLRLRAGDGSASVSMRQSGMPLHPLPWQPSSSCASDEDMPGGVDHATVSTSPSWAQRVLISSCWTPPDIVVPR